MKGLETDSICNKCNNKIKVGEPCITVNIDVVKFSSQTDVIVEDSLCLKVFCLDCIKELKIEEKISSVL